MDPDCRDRALRRWIVTMCSPWYLPSKALFSRELSLCYIEAIIQGLSSKKTYINGAGGIELLLLFWRLWQPPFCTAFLFWTICGKWLFPALGFIADETVSMLLRVWVHPPFAQIVLLRLQRFLALGAPGVKPRLRYRSDSQALKLDHTIWFPPTNRDEPLFHCFVFLYCTISNESSYAAS